MKPINSIPAPQIFTEAQNSSRSGFLLTLTTLRYWLNLFLISDPKLIKSLLKKGLLKPQNGLDQIQLWRGVFKGIAAPLKGF